MRWPFAAVIMLAVALAAAGQVPERTEQLVYSVEAYDGNTYARTFVLDDAPVIYLLADADSFLTLRKNFVFFWPITNEWLVDVSGLDVQLDGTLEIRRRDSVETLGPVRFSYYRRRDAGYPGWESAVGAAADEAMLRYEQVTDAYWEANRRYIENLAAHERLVTETTRMIAQASEAGTDVSTLRAALALLQPPAEPEYPDDYIAPPTAIRVGFVINLPAGEYEIRFVSSSGRTIEGSERSLVVFDERRSGAVGIEVIPGSKWTRPEESRWPDSVVYTDGSTDLYLTVFNQRQYNDLYYEKLRSSAAQGNPLVAKWVRTELVEGGKLQVTWRGEDRRTLSEEFFVVEQTPGATRGYRILPYDLEARLSGKTPSIRAFPISFDGTTRGGASIRALDHTGEPLATSARRIRVVTARAVSPTLLGLVVAPLVVMTAVLLRRRRRR